MRWQLFIEEYYPGFRYIKGSHNVVADVLSRLPKEPDSPLDNSLEIIKILLVENHLRTVDLGVEITPHGEFFSYCNILKMRQKGKQYATCP
jgi:hypothetical protein